MLGKTSITILLLSAFLLLSCRQKEEQEPETELSLPGTVWVCQRDSETSIQFNTDSTLLWWFHLTGEDFPDNSHIYLSVSGTYTRDGNQIVFSAVGKDIPENRYGLMKSELNGNILTVPSYIYYRKEKRTENWVDYYEKQSTRQ